MKLSAWAEYYHHDSFKNRTMKTISQYIVLTFVLVFTSTVFSQNGKIQSVKDDYRDFAYIKTFSLKRSRGLCRGRSMDEKI